MRIGRGSIELRLSEASQGGMKVRRIKDPLYKDYYLRISHLRVQVSTNRDDLAARSERRAS